MEEHLTAFLPGAKHPRALLFAHTSRRKSGLLSVKLGSHTLIRHGLDTSPSPPQNPFLICAEGPMDRQEHWGEGLLQLSRLRWRVFPG